MTELTIEDVETGEEVGTLEDGELATEDQFLRETAEEITEEGGVQMLAPVESEGVHAYHDWLITPEDDGFEKAFVQQLPHPYSVDAATLAGLDTYKPSDDEIPDSPEGEDTTEKAATAILDAFFRDAGVSSGTAGVGQATYGGAGEPEDEEEEVAEEAVERTLGKSELRKTEECLDDVLHKIAWWGIEKDSPDLSKAPAVDDQVPDFVAEHLENTIDDELGWDKFQGYSRQAAQAIQNDLEENLTQPQGWSLRSLVDDIQEMYSGMSDEKAMNIARTETAVFINSAKARAYESQPRSDVYKFYWQGPTDHRTTKVCEEIEQEIEAKGGSVPMETLKGLLMEKARKYEGTREGGTPERAKDFLPHYQCRRSVMRDVKANL